MRDQVDVMRRIAALIGTFALVFGNNPATAESISVTSGKYFPGWEHQMMKINAFRGCMLDYGVDFSKWGDEYKAFWRRHQLKVDEWEMGSRLSKYPDFDERYNKALTIINEECYQAANRMNPGTFRIDYRKGGKRGWRSHAAQVISFTECLDSDPRFSTSLKKKLVNEWINAGEMKPTPHDMKNIRLRIDPLGVSDISTAREVNGAGTKRCSKILSEIANLYKLDDQNGNPVKPNDAHNKCLQAKDYEGCMRFSQSKVERTQATDICEGVVCLVKTKANDIYGLPKPFNYKYRQLEDGRLMYWSRFYRIPHKGQEARYIGFKRITRYYRTPEAGTSGSFIGGGSASTNCTGYGGSISCTTTGSSPTYIPGRSATPGGIVSAVFTNIFDCKDMTEATYKNGKLVGRWEKYNQEEYFNGLLKDKCDAGTSELRKLPILGLKL